MRVYDTLASASALARMIEAAGFLHVLFLVMNHLSQFHTFLLFSILSTLYK
jgi:hypothetical protein